LYAGSVFGRGKIRKSVFEESNIDRFNHNNEHMKFDIGTIFYIVLIVGSVIFSAIKKNQKKHKEVIDSDEEATSETPQPTWQRELTDILGMPTEPPKQKPIPVVEPVSVVKPRPPEPVKTVPSAVPFQHNPAPVLHEDDEHIGHSYVEEFDPERAVIYSEILNRKYF
jgi:hypothetical protein